MLFSFKAYNTANETGLWETSGIAAGTFELAPITGASASGLSPSNLTNFEGEALFEGRDTARPFRLVGDKRNGGWHARADRHHRRGCFRAQSQ